jgi:hypothetical protein
MGFIGKNGTVIEMIHRGLGVMVESNDGDSSIMAGEDPYKVTLSQMSFGGGEQVIELIEDELMKVVEQVCKERPNFARGVSRIYFRQQKARRKASL